jgi:D-sedoheptulose 7-phosphate isomerase
VQCAGNWSSMKFAERFLAEVIAIAQQLDINSIEKMAAELAALRERGGRLFVLGVGGSAANASHAVNDFRKLAGLEAYSPTDNVSELTARVNDEGWLTVFEAWLCVSRLGSSDAVLVLSVGGGSAERNVSANIVSALDYAQSVGARILGIVGRDGGHTARVSDACVIVPTVHPDRITPHAEAFQAIVWHLLVSHPAVQRNTTKWESIVPQKRAVFLDRDGVLNRVVIHGGKPHPPAHASDLEIPSGTAEALARLKQHDFLLLVVTNQPDVSRGTQLKENIEEISRRLNLALPLDGVYVCYHDDQDECDCRKPHPGLLLRAAREHGIDLRRSYLIGDRWRDVDAGANAGCTTVWIDSAYAERDPTNPPHGRVASLPEAVDWILSRPEESQ